MKTGTKTLLVLAGPTASGKTELAIMMAKQLGTEIISADSRQFYRELSIGTAKPSPEQLAEVKHHMIGHISISDDYNISKFETEVILLLKELFNTLDTVVMCGGSGLYIDAVCNGIDQQPAHDLAIRAELTARFNTRGIAFLQEELLKLDPDYYRQVDQHNPRRLIRALEVCKLTGKPYSQFRKGTRKERPFRTVKLGIDWPREELIRRIDRRTDDMMGHGLLEEARAWYPFRHLNALNTVGYKELFAYFDGLCTLEEAVASIKVNTRRYAKRQMTWFRKDKEINWYRPGDLTEVVIRQALNG